MTNISSASFVSEPERMNGSYESFESFNPSQTLSNFLDENNHQGSVYRGARVIVQPLGVRIEETLRSALLRFRHPNLCLIMGLIRTSNDNVSVIYESCPGGSLKEALKMVQFSSGQKMKILSDISHALYYMHSNCPSMIHPSLDTGNILLDTVVEHELDYLNVKIGDICSLQPGDPSDDIPRFGNIACEVFPDMPQPIHEFIQRCVSVDVYSRPQSIDICRVFKTGT
jgi:serine/threonine protein kinase